MDSVKGAVRASISIEALTDDRETPVPREFFKDQVIKDIENSAGAVLSVEDYPGGDIMVRVIDPHASQGYLKFSSGAEYDKWLQSSLHEPSEEEIMEALRDA